MEVVKAFNSEASVLFITFAKRVRKDFLVAHLYFGYEA